jgi:hypothetical protein
MEGAYVELAIFNNSVLPTHVLANIQTIRGLRSGFTKRCRLSWLTDRSLVFMSPNAGGGGCGVSANEYSCAHRAKINVGDLLPYLSYD